MSGYLLRVPVPHGPIQSAPRLHGSTPPQRVKSNARPVQNLKRSPAEPAADEPPPPSTTQELRGVGRGAGSGTMEDGEEGAAAAEAALGLKLKTPALRGRGPRRHRRRQRRGLRVLPPVKSPSVSFSLESTPQFFSPFRQCLSPPPQPTCRLVNLPFFSGPFLL